MSELHGPRRSHRPTSLVAVLAAVLAMGPAAAAPAAPVIRAATTSPAVGTTSAVPEAKPGRARLTVRLSHLVPHGRASVRRLARDGGTLERRAGRPVLAAPPRDRWQRPASSPAGVSDRGPVTLATLASLHITSVAEPAASGGVASTTVGEPAPVPDPQPAASLEQAATGGPGVIGPAWNGLTDRAVPCGTSRPCVEPANPSVAVSGTHVVQAVSEAMRFTTRTGGGATQISNRAFFGVASWSSTAFVAEPGIVFDRAHARWIATLFAGTCSAGALFVAVSATADPKGAWDRYHLQFEGRWPASPALGLSSTLVAIGVNETSVSCGPGGAPVVGPYAGTRLHVIDVADLESGAGTPAVASTDPDPAAFAFTPAVGTAADGAIHAVVALADGSQNRADLGYVAIDGSVAGGLEVRAPVNLTNALGLAKLADPPTPVDAGGLIGVQRNALDLRPTGAAWSSGRLLVTSTARCAVGSATRPCGRVTELATAADLGIPTLRQDLRIDPTSGFTDTFVPGAAYADDGTIWVAYSQGGAGRNVSAWARRQTPGTPPGSWSPGSAVIAAGRGPYGGTAGAGLNERWGDRVAVVPDPLAPSAAWQANQFADTGGGWATRVARLGDDAAPPVVGVPRPRFPTRVVASATSAKLDITWTASDAGSGVASIAVQRSLDGGAWSTIATLGGATSSVRVAVAYGRRHAFRIRATDHAGNPSSWVAGAAFTPALVGERSSAVAYRGTWSTGRSSRFLGGRARYTGVARRKATITFTGLAVAWVASTGPTRGRARVYADGTYLGSFSTYGSTTRHRQVIAARTFPTAGRHTLKVKVAGTARHPRVDVDAFVILR